MTARFILAMLICVFTFALSLQYIHAGNQSQQLVFQSVVVDGRPLSIPSSGCVNVGAFPKRIAFVFNINTNFPTPIRLRYKLAGFENIWHDGGGFMFLGMRFLDDSGDQMAQQNYQVSGDSAGWDGSLRNSPLVHRRETLVVPQKASRALVVISSAGPPSTVGVYVVANLNMFGTSSNTPLKALIQSPLDRDLDNNPDQLPPGWIHDGTHPSMAKVVQIGQYPPKEAFAIEDNDLNGHAEWHYITRAAPLVRPGENLIVEWDEMFSIGLVTFPSAIYSSLDPTDFKTIIHASLAPGKYSFHIIGVDIMGNPTGAEASVNILVAQPFWKTLQFWIASIVATIIIIAGSARYIVRYKLRTEMLRLKKQGELERERLRIAHDIHDDLGARITQISLVSAISQDDASLQEKARIEFGRITQMSRDLVSALYETVWAVNPEYDNLYALGNYLCQMVNQLCERTNFRCRLDVSVLPREIQVSSQVRHNITMVVKEAINNVIKHASASEVTLCMSLKNDVLDISVCDNGCGFQHVSQDGGYGLTTMKQRMENIGGECSIESTPGHGSAIRLRLRLQSIYKRK